MKKTLLVLAIAMSLTSPVAAGPPTTWNKVQAIAVEVKGDGLDRTCTLVNVTRTSESGVPVTEIIVERFITLALNVTGLWGCSDRAWRYQQVILDYQFIVNTRGTEATLTHPEATVIFKSVRDFAVLSDTTKTVKDTLTGTDQSYRLVEREDWYHAGALCLRVSLRPAAIGVDLVAMGTALPDTAEAYEMDQVIAPVRIT